MNRKRDIAILESREKIFKYLNEKHYFKCRDELLKYHEVDIAEFLEDIIEEIGIKKSVIMSDYFQRIFLLKFFHIYQKIINWI